MAPTPPARSCMLNPPLLVVQDEMYATLQCASPEQGLWQLGPRIARSQRDFRLRPVCRGLLLEAGTLDFGSTLLTRWYKNVLYVAGYARDEMYVIWIIKSSASLEDNSERLRTAKACRSTRLRICPCESTDRDTPEQYPTTILTTSGNCPASSHFLLPDYTSPRERSRQKCFAHPIDQPWLRICPFIVSKPSWSCPQKVPPKQQGYSQSTTQSHIRPSCIRHHRNHTQPWKSREHSRRGYWRRPRSRQVILYCK